MFPGLFFFLQIIRPIISTPQMTISGSMDSEGSNVKRGSILGMAVTGVRNLLAVSLFFLLLFYK